MQLVCHSQLPVWLVTQSQGMLLTLQENLSQKQEGEFPEKEKNGEGGGRHMAG